MNFFFLNHLSLQSYLTEIEDLSHLYLNALITRIVVENSQDLLAANHVHRLCGAQRVVEWWHVRAEKSEQPPTSTIPAH